MSYTIDRLEIGQKATFSKTLSESDVYLFAGISGDLNPAHINEELSKKSLFKTRIVHGALTSSLISTVLGMTLPGNGTIFIENNVKFKKPVYFNDTITAEVEVVEILLEKNIVKFNTRCLNQKDEVVVEGNAVVMPPRKE